MAGSKGVKITIVVVAFAAAGVIYMTTQGDPESPREPEDVRLVDLVCLETGEHIQKTPVELKQFEASKPRRGGRRGMQAPEADARTVYPLADCGEGGAVLANRCPKCGGYYASEDSEGNPATCESCP